MFKDKDLRKVFAELVKNLGGETEERLYSVGGIYGIDDDRIYKQLQQKVETLDNIYNRQRELLSALLKYLNLEAEGGVRIKKIKK